jgi:hypothetical protein
MTKKELLELSAPTPLIYRRVIRGEVVLTDVTLRSHEDGKPLILTGTHLGAQKVSVAVGMLAVPDSELHQKWLQEVAAQQERFAAEEAGLERVRNLVRVYNDQLAAAGVPLRFLYPYSVTMAMDLRLDSLTEAEAAEIMAKLLRR